MSNQMNYSQFLKDENIVWIENEYLRLGANLALGGALTYLAEHGKDNLINSFDWGRQVQMSFYGFPNPYCPEGFEVKESWKYLGWNPIQSGDCYGHRSDILDWKCENGEIYVKCIPRQWPMNNCPGECTFEAWYRLEGKTVRVTSRINNDRSDRTLYPARSQEQPAVYTNGPWYKLVSYLGDAPFTGGALTEICTKENGLGWPWEHFWPTEYWTALVDDDNYGLGVYNGQTCLFIGGFAGKMGKGGPKDAPTGYISPLSSEILDHNIVYTYQYALIVGSLDEIRKTAGLIDDPKCRSFFDFTNDRSHFTYENITDKGWGKQTGLEFDFNAEGKLVSPAIYLDKNCGKLLLDAAFTGGEVRGKLTLKHLPRTRNQEIETCSVDFVLAADGTRQLHTIDFSAIACPSIGFSLDFAGDGHAQIFSAQLT